MPYHAITDQGKTLKGKMHHHLRLGHSNIDTLYFKLWGAVSTRALRSVSNHMWEAQTLPFRAIRYILQYRSGLLWNEKLRKRFARTPQPACTGNCPLCGKSDSAGHVLGGCTHPHPKGQIFKRHNQQVWAIYKAITSGKHGAAFSVVDAGAHQDYVDGLEGDRPLASHPHARQDTHEG